MTKHGSTLEQRVVRAAESVLEQHRFVSPVDVLLGLGWLAPSHVDQWRQGRIECLEGAMGTKTSRIAAAMALLEAWAAERGLEPSETAYVARTRDRRPLRFSQSGDAASERAYHTHWVSRELSDKARDRLQERASRPPDLVVVSPLKDWTCTESGGSGDLLLMEDAGPLCMTCAELDHLVFLPAGDAALTRRAKRASEYPRSSCGSAGRGGATSARESSSSRARSRVRSRSPSSPRTSPPARADRRCGS
jgi:hypothetical protein